MGFSRQEYSSGLPFPPPGDLPHPGIEPASCGSPVWQAEWDLGLERLFFQMRTVGTFYMSSPRLPWWLSGKESACNAGSTGDAGSIPGWGRSPGAGHGNLLQYSCLENPMDREAWWATVQRVAKSQDMTEHAHKHMSSPRENGTEGKRRPRGSERRQ